MRLDEVAIVDVATADLNRSAVVERLGRHAVRIERRGVPVLLRPVIAVGQPEPGFLMREDRGTRSAEGGVRPGLVGVPVRVENGADGFRPLAEGCKQGFPVCGRAGVDEHAAVAGRKRYAVDSAAPQHRYSVVDRGDHDSLRRLRLRVPARDRSGGQARRQPAQHDAAARRSAARAPHSVRRRQSRPCCRRCSSARARPC